MTGKAWAGWALAGAIGFVAGRGTAPAEAIADPTSYAAPEEPASTAPAPAPTEVETREPREEPAPRYEPPPRPTPAPVSLSFGNCSEARAAGAAPVYAGDPGYSRRLDRDGDGVGCER